MLKDKMKDKATLEAWSAELDKMMNSLEDRPLDLPEILDVVIALDGDIEKKLCIASAVGAMFLAAQQRDKVKKLMAESQRPAAQGCGSHDCGDCGSDCGSSPSEDHKDNGPVP